MALIERTTNKQLLDIARASSAVQHPAMQAFIGDIDTKVPFESASETDIATLSDLLDLEEALDKSNHPDFHDFETYAFN
ncbi:hypothetical protein [Reinekea sp. G2M2-21]|uniref:hypothetical protein n=1 Tax=Reinekea sp. G2M2-21 TaxID=2788942 RepID=UPI0018AC4EC1|nr:hypothetical protein [Reinekea sp. G2M2-21]